MARSWIAWTRLGSRIFTCDRMTRPTSGRIRTEPHHYSPETGHYLIYGAVDPADRAYGLLFETEGGLVTSFRVGTLDAIALVEGCS